MARIRSIKPETPALRWRRSGLELHGDATALYRIWTAAGELLYVGVTGNPVERWRAHAQRKAWWPEVSLITWEVLPKEHLALTAERAAIRHEKPRHNVRSAVAA
jgi:predicted GIY-YIG superfamily endonuclease